MADLQQWLPQSSHWQSGVRCPLPQARGAAPALSRTDHPRGGQSDRPGHRSALEHPERHLQPVYARVLGGQRYASPRRTDPRTDLAEALLSRPRTVTRPPVVIFLPILHKGESLTDSFARYFAARGIAALSLRGKKNFLKGNQGLLFTKEVFRQMIVDIRRGMDWLEVQPEVDGKRIGICGLSLGAVESVIVAGVDNRVSCAAYLLGGGNIPKILMTSQEKDIVRFRRDTMAAEGLDAEGFYTKVLSGYQDIDPLTYAGRLPPQQVLMVNAYFDTVVRREYANALWERSGQ